jgi:hypothetical protein
VAGPAGGARDASALAAESARFALKTVVFTEAGEVLARDDEHPLGQASPGPALA